MRFLHHYKVVHIFSTEVLIYFKATFQVYYWIGWKPDPSQPKPLKPQKSDISLKDLDKLDEIAHTMGTADLSKDGK